MDKKEHSLIGTLLALPLLIPLASLSLFLPKSTPQREMERPLRISFLQSLAPEAHEHACHWVNVNMPHHIPARSSEDCDFVVVQAPLSDFSLLQSIHKPVIILPENM